MDDIVYKEIESYGLKTNNKCGLPVTDLCFNLGIKYDDLKKSLNALYKANKIKVMDGINSKLIFIK